MPITVHEFKADAITILAKIMFNLFNFNTTQPECKRVQIMLKAQSQNCDRLVTQDVALYAAMFSYISKYNVELKSFHSEVMTNALEALQETSNEGEYLKLCEIAMWGHNKTAEMLNTLKDYDKIISAHICSESNSIMVVIGD